MWLVRSWPTPSPGFRLKVAEILDVYMVVSGESVCEEVHPCRVIMIYSNSRVLCYGLHGCLSAPLDLLIALISVQELQLVSGVCRICVGGRA